MTEKESRNAGLGRAFGTRRKHRHSRNFTPGRITAEIYSFLQIGGQAVNKALKVELQCYIKQKFWVRGRQRLVNLIKWFRNHCAAIKLP